MSAVETTIQPRPRIPQATKAAIIAYLGAGHTQAQAAARFKVHPNSVYALWKLVKQSTNIASPTSKEWKEQVLPAAQASVERAIDYHQDVIGAANVALKLMHGIGYLSSDSKVHVDGNVALSVSWLPVQAPTEDAEILSISESDITPETHD